MRISRQGPFQRSGRLCRNRPYPTTWAPCCYGVTQETELARGSLLVWGRWFRFRLASFYGKSAPLASCVHLLLMLVALVFPNALDRVHRLSGSPGTRWSRESCIKGQLPRGRPRSAVAKRAFRPSDFDQQGWPLCKAIQNANDCCLHFLVRRPFPFFLLHCMIIFCHMLFFFGWRNFSLFSFILIKEKKRKEK